MSKMKKAIMWLNSKAGYILAALALVTATASVGATCFYTSYQPEIPSELNDIE